ncbi:MAG: hypothetical protein PHW04_12805 [Candidatus Wallbacteria bacterium]|nr:hypothetical protein [Candidatus Wallbacteria bacterium]
MKTKILTVLLLAAFSIYAGALEDELMDAIQKRNMTRIRDLINAGARINTINEKNLTPLKYAIQLGYSDVARFLLRMGDYPANSGLFSAPITEQAACNVNCHVIEDALLMFNHTGKYCELIRFEYNEDRCEYDEIFIDQKIIEKIKEFLPAQILPVCPAGGEYIIYPKRRLVRPDDVHPELGVYCSEHGTAVIAHHDSWFKTKPADIEIDRISLN